MKKLIIFLFLFLPMLAYSQIDLNERAIENQCKIYGYWDHLEGPEHGRGFLEHVNTGKSFGAGSAEEILAQGIDVIVSISHSLESDDSLEEWRRKLKGHANFIREYNPANVPFILIMDEPLSKGFTIDQLETMIEEARKIIGSNYKYGYNFRIGNVRKGKLPQNADIISVNIYPFYEHSFFDNEIETQEEFDRLFYKTVQDLRKNAPNSKYIITGQAFFQSGKWRKPPTQSPLWYATAIQNTHDVIGLIWFEWRDRSRWKGAGSMPELYENQKQAFKILCPN